MAELSRLRIGGIIYSFNDTVARTGNLPPGGEKHKTLIKQSEEDYKTEWASLEALFSLNFTSADVVNETLYLTR